MPLCPLQVIALMSRDYIDQSNRLGNALILFLTQFLKLKCKNWAERENSNSRKSDYRHTTINYSDLDLIVNTVWFASKCYTLVHFST